MIYLQDWIAAIPPEDKCIAYAGENDEQIRQFFLPDLSFADYSFWLDMAFDLSTITVAGTPREVQTSQQTTTEVVNADGTSVTATASSNKESYVYNETTVEDAACTDIAPLRKEVREDGILLTWKIYAQQTQLAGVLRATLRALGPENSVRKSAMMTFCVAASVEATPAKPVPMSEHEQLERLMVDSFETAADEKLAELEDWYDSSVADFETIKAYVDEKAAPAVMGGDAGTVKLHGEAPYSGLIVSGDEILRISPASETDIDARVNPFRPITPAYLEYAVKSVGDAYYVTEELMDKQTAQLSADIAAGVAEAKEYADSVIIPAVDGTEILNEAKAYADEKTAPAEAESGDAGTVKIGDGNSTGLHINTRGELSVYPATEHEINNRGLMGMRPIVTGCLDYAVKAVGDGYYATESAVAEAIAEAKAYTDAHAATGYTLTEQDKQDIAAIVADEVIHPLEVLIDESGVLARAMKR